MKTFISENGLYQGTFILLGKRMYSIECPSPFNNPDNFMHFHGGYYPLEESEDIETLEMENLKANKDEISELAFSICKEHANTLNISEKKLQDLIGAFRGDEFEIKKFFLFDVFLGYKKGIQDMDSIYNANGNNDLPEENFNFNDLLDGKERLTELYDSPGILIISRRVFKVVEKVINESEKIHIDNKDYGIGNLNCSLERLEDSYEKCITSYIRSTISKNSEKLVRVMKENLEERVGKYKEQLENKGELRFKKINDKQYEIYLVFSNFVMKKNNGYYLFNGGEIGITINVQPKKGKDSSIKFSIESPPNVFTQQYDHPFWGLRRKKFCYDGDGRWIWNRKKIPFRTNSSEENALIEVNQTNRRDIACMVGYVMRQGLAFIYYPFGTMPPERNLSGFEKEFLGNGEEGKLVAKKRGYREGNIKDNDKRKS